MYRGIYISSQWAKKSHLEGTRRESNVAMENLQFIDDFPIKTTSYRGLSIAMFIYQRVLR